MSPNFSKPILKIDFTHPHEFFVAIDIRGVKSRYLGTHCVGIAAVVEHLSVIKTNTVKRRYRLQLDVIGETTAAQPPELFEEKRRGNDGRTCVEGEAVLPMDVGTTAGRIELFNYGDAVASRAKANGSGQTAKSAPYDHGVRAPMPRRPRPSHEMRQVRRKLHHTLQCN